MAELPRRAAVPTPHGTAPGKLSSSRRPFSGGAREETLQALRNKLAEYKDENTLLGALVKGLKAERDCLTKRAAASGRAAAESGQQVEALSKDAGRLASEAERLTAMVASHSLRLQKSKQHQQELEDVVLDLRCELEAVTSQLGAAKRDAAAAMQAAAASDAKLAAAGLAAMPKMGPTAEQLIINSTRRITELMAELSAAKADAAQQLAAGQQEQQLCERQWQQQLADARAAAADAQRQADAQAQQLADAQQQCQQLAERLEGAQALAQARGELQQLQQQMLQQSNSQQQVAQLQAQLADRQLLRDSESAQQLLDAQERAAQLQAALAAAHREHAELTAALVAARQQESGGRVSAGEAAAKGEALRTELVRCVGELSAQLEQAAAQGAARSQALQQLRAAEAAAAAAREEAAELRSQLVKLASTSLGELRQQLASEASAISGLPDADVAGLPLPVASYVKVLEAAVLDSEQRCQALLGDAQRAQQAEREARAALSGAREAAAGAERALTQQTQRLQALEQLRLSDLRDVQGLEQRLQLAQQECWRLRDALLDARGHAVAAAGTAALVGSDSGGGGDAPWPAGVAPVAVGDATQQRLQPSCSSVAAGAGGSKAEQLRQLKAQLQRGWRVSCSSDGSSSSRARSSSSGGGGGGSVAGLQPARMDACGAAAGSRSGASTARRQQPGDSGDDAAVSPKELEGALQGQAAAPGSGAWQHQHQLPLLAVAPWELRAPPLQQQQQ